MKKALVLLLLVASTVLNCFSQEKIGKQKLIEDYNQFMRYLEDTHPDPYSVFGDIIEFKRKSQELRYSITDNMTIDEFKELLSGFVAVIGDGHTFISSHSSRSENDNPKEFPVDLKIAQDGIFIQNADAAYKKYIGAQILSVNGQPIDTLLVKVKKTRPTENDYGVYYELLKLLKTDKSAALILEKPGQLALSVKNKAGQTGDITISYAQEPRREKAGSKLKLKEDNTILYSQLLGDKKSPVGYFRWNGVYSREVVEAIARDHPGSLDMNLNGFYNMLEKERPKDDAEALKGIPGLYPVFSDLLKSMKDNKSKYLLIDLRENSGGMTPLCQPLCYMMYGDTYLNAEIKAEYNRKLSTLYLKKIGLESIEQFNERHNTIFALGDFVFDHFFGYHKKQAIEEKRKDLSLITYFNGIGKEYTETLNGIPIYRPQQVIVLTSPTTFSAAYHFMYMLTQIDPGCKVIGVPSRQAGNTYMESTSFSLPHSGLAGSISNSMQLFYPNDPEKGKVYTPDYPMKWEDYRKYDFDENAEILYVLDLIKEGKI